MATMIDWMVARVHTGTGVLTWRGGCPTRYGRVQDFCTTVTGEFLVTLNKKS